MTRTKLAFRPKTRSRSLGRQHREAEQRLLRVIRVDIAFVRSLVRYTQHRTLLRPTETRLPVALLRPICENRPAAAAGRPGPENHRERDVQRPLSTCQLHFSRRMTARSP